ncbi:hypothetical protein YDYSG_07080 [Paenibacillus tyrfis]|uniref:hypothetical protein n=1 Tax=Paenibacillus tyrfis TaxID=1501230 RepID=UPI002491CB1B|nr:hypothetical protein [Paenibacillus tyrfis]GLI04678.1 hypothetical protein YDYSG_07080 [Paenibacillus tyrfis]
MNHESFHYEMRGFVELGLAMLAVVVFVLYVYAAIAVGRRFKPWPFYRYVCWFIWCWHGGYGCDRTIGSTGSYGFCGSYDRAFAAWNAGIKV